MLIFENLSRNLALDSVDAKRTRNGDKMKKERLHMSRIFKNLVPYWKSCVVIVLLLFLQAYCDLSLPAYTSDIIDTGIQNGGVLHVCPEAITAKEFENAMLLMTDSEKETWRSIYQQDGDIYTLKEKSNKKLSEYDEIFQLPLIIINQMSEEDVNQMAAAVSMGMMPQSAIDEIRSQASEKIDEVGSTLVKSMGISYAKKQDAAAGLDMDSIQTRYLWISGGKMVVMALLMALTTILVGLVASRVAAGVGRDLRKSIYTKVLGFSNAEMDKYLGRI